MARSNIEMQRKRNRDGALNRYLFCSKIFSDTNSSRAIPQPGYYYVQNPQSICHTQIKPATLVQNLSLIHIFADNGVGGFAAAQPLEDFVEHLGVGLALRALCGVEELEIVCDAQPGEHFLSLIHILPAPRKPEKISILVIV